MLCHGMARAIQLQSSKILVCGAMKRKTLEFHNLRPFSLLSHEQKARRPDAKGFAFSHGIILEQLNLAPRRWSFPS